MADVHGIPVVHVDEGITAGCHQRAVQQQRCGGRAFNAKSVGVSESLAVLLPQVISKAQALGFIMAIVFNVPCTMTVAATYRENHSAKWIVLSIGYYVAFSLAISCVFYHIGLLIW